MRSVGFYGSEFTVGNEPESHLIIAFGYNEEGLEPTDRCIIWTGLAAFSRPDELPKRYLLGAQIATLDPLNERFIGLQDAEKVIPISRFLLDHIVKR